VPFRVKHYNVTGAEAEVEGRSVIGEALRIRALAATLRGALLAVGDGSATLVDRHTEDPEEVCAADLAGVAAEIERAALEVIKLA